MHHKAIRIWTASVLAVLFVAAKPGSATAASARADIDAVNTKFMALVAKGDAAGLAALYAADGQVLPPNSDFASGAAGIQKLWQGVMDSGIKGAKFTTLDLLERGDLAVETGKYDLTGADGKVLDSGKYVVVWKREGGRWKLYRDIFNSSLAAK